MEGRNKTQKAVLITGATGFLGTQVTRRILKLTGHPVIVLVRGEDESGAEQRLERIWWDWPEMVKEIGGRIRVLNGDLCLPGFGIKKATYEELIGTVSHIIHIAADIRLNEPLDNLRKINVEGIQNVLELAYDIQRFHGLTRLSYVSTAYVAGGRKGVVTEEDLTDRFGFLNQYELSKYEGESLIREAGRGLPISIFRPGMVIGDSKSGAVKTFNTLYFPLRLYLTGKLKYLPVDPLMKINMIPCDYVSEAIATLTFEPKAEGVVFHLTLPDESLPTVKEMLEFTREWAAKNLHIKLPKPVFLPLKVSQLRWVSCFLREKSAVHSLLSLASYFEENRIYRRDNLDRLMGAYSENWRSFFPQILTYACDHGFLHHSDRTVQEQVLFRLMRKNRRIRYHDVTTGTIMTRNAEEVEQEIRKAVSALQQLGIKAGDRVALVGFNSSRYFIIDTAIGLSGAVSVPLYYSSPVSELTEILKDSGARLIFIGVPDILEKYAASDTTIPAVSFCRQETQWQLPANFMNWRDFLDKGETDQKAKDKNTMYAPVRFGDIATLRYTSGTTGQPRGAAFDHAGLRSMAETLASLPPWRARTRRVVYLSFLPMNHVVEGILASYSIYYTPAPVDLYYLENFHDLQKALPKIRPTVFFSVPRFYEKVWESAAQSWVGRQYLKRRDGLTRRFLGRLLGIAVRKKAGIDRCAQLIVGSAPISQSLLANFRAIGIEVHNAYGLTEAPLITMNRHRANRIDTVGEPLPGTLIRIAEDGEVLVKGPQVMKGYATESPLEDGWLHTGDYGSLTEDGYLVLCGRKKETVINSYGKNINPVKVELLLRDATGIDQIMLCGDDRPYCTALLFGCSADDPARNASVTAGVRAVNQTLSHPEQIKRWTVLTEKLTIEGGELTANLKMKRSVIAAKYAEAIAGLYEDNQKSS